MTPECLSEAIALLRDASTLIIRASALLQPAAAAATPELAPPSGASTKDPPRMDKGRWAVSWRGRDCVLGATMPFRLLERLCRRPNWFVRPDDLIQDVWRGDPVSPNTVRTSVRRLKRRLARAGMKRLANAVQCRGGCYALMVESL